MELANVQLTELEAYDRLLDEAVERSYRDLSARRGFRWSGNDRVQREHPGNAHRPRAPER